nr:hypothetical protein [Tanacetum cinerariifolium]
NAITPILPTEEPEYSHSMGYEHLNTTLEIKLDEIIKFGVKELVPIPRECEVTSEDKNECDVPVCENSPIFDDHYEILSNFNNDDISSDDDAFEDIEYVEASLPDLELVSLEEENDERLINLVENDNSDSSNDPLLEEVDLFLSDDSIPPGIENFADDPEGDIRFLEELLINDSILSHDSFDSNFEDNPSISRPPPEPPDDNFDLEPEVISVVMEDIDEPDEHFNPGGEIFVSTNNEDVDYFPF